MTTSQEHTRSPDSDFRILSLDGGPGTHMMLQILYEIAREHPDCLEQVNMFAGSSSGALAALYLAKEMSKGAKSADAIKGCIKFMEEVIASFKCTKINTLMFLAGISPLFDSTDLYALLDETFGEMTMGDLEQKKRLVSIQFFNATKGKASTYNTTLSKEETKLAAVARATSAFHPLMPVFQAPSENDTGKGDLMFDGVFSSNAPILSAIQDAILALGKIEGKNKKSTTVEVLGRLSILSMGLVIEAPGYMKTASRYYPRPFVSLRNMLLGEDGDPQHLPYGWTWSLWRLLWGGAEKLLGASPQDEAVFANVLLGADRFHRFTPSNMNRGEFLKLIWSQWTVIGESTLRAQWFWAGSLNKAIEKYGYKPWFPETSSRWKRVLGVGLQVLSYFRIIIDDDDVEAAQSKKDLLDWLEKNHWIESQSHTTYGEP